MSAWRAALYALAIAASTQVALGQPPAAGLPALVTVAAGDRAGASLAPAEARDQMRERLAQDLDAMRVYRPGYPFWRHIYTIDDRSVAFGSASDGRLLVTFPVRGDWLDNAHWMEPALASLIEGVRLQGSETDRRAQVVQLLEPVVGPVVHHATRGTFLWRNAERYGSFLAEWGAIFERFGVPAEIGLAQAIVESGLDGRIRSEAGALGFCQWMPRNWSRLKRLAPYEIEGFNQTTQAPFCAAYLTILATRYGSFIPALSEHHAGGVNVGRTIVNGSFVGGETVRARYFLGADLNLRLRQISSPMFREVVGSYGPRSFRYVELVFGNTANVVELAATVTQRPIHAMRTERPLSLDEIVRRTGLAVDEVRRYNPALVRQVPARANLYLPEQIDEFGRDVSFWRRPPAADYADVLADFLRLEQRFAPEDWDGELVLPALLGFQRRFRETGTEEGVVMAVVIGYVMEEINQGRRAQIMADFRSNERVYQLLEHGVTEYAIRLVAFD
jgi:hypothetical protein